jgi:hypothetical protein
VEVEFDFGETGHECEMFQVRFKPSGMD